MSEWIKCSERLPEESGTYLTYVRYECFYVYDFSAKHQKWNCMDWFDAKAASEVEIKGVSHWMPLPDAPEVEG